jgi:hypothetical protein
MNPSAYQTFSAFAIPLVLIPVSALIKKIVRGKSSFRLDDFYLGLDLTLAAFSLAAVNVIEINPNGRVNLGWYFVVTLIVLMLQVALHQQWAGTSVIWWKPFWLLGLLSNGLGISLLGFFIRWKIEGKL